MELTGWWGLWFIRVPRRPEGRKRQAGRNERAGWFRDLVGLAAEQGQGERQQEISVVCFLGEILGSTLRVRETLQRKTPFWVISLTWSGAGYRL